MNSSIVTLYLELSHCQLRILSDDALSKASLVLQSFERQAIWYGSRRSSRRMSSSERSKEKYGNTQDTYRNSVNIHPPATWCCLRLLFFSLSFAKGLGETFTEWLTAEGVTYDLRRSITSGKVQAAGRNSLTEECVMQCP